MKSLNILAAFLLFGYFGLAQQVALESITTDYCSETNKGTIEVTLSKKSLSPFQPPYNVEYYNIDTDYYGDYYATEDNFIIDDLDAGSYILTVHLTDELSIMTDCPFIENPNNITVIDITHSCNDNGSIELLDDGLITYTWEDGLTDSFRGDLTPGLYKVTATFPDGWEQGN